MRYLTSLCLTALLLACSPGDVTDRLTPLPPPDGRWRVINYWAAWCHPCREEIPELNRLAAKMADSVIVLGVNHDNPPPAEHLAQAAALGIRYPLLAADPAAQLRYPPPTALPTTLLIAPNGELWARLLGPQTAASLRAAMRGPAQPPSDRLRPDPTNSQQGEMP